MAQTARKAAAKRAAVRGVTPKLRPRVVVPRSFSEVAETAVDEATDIQASMGNQLVVVQFRIPLEMLNDVSQLLRSRDAHIDDFMRLAIRNMLRGVNHYGLRDTLKFGKYFGEPVEAVIRTDPSYIAWAQRKMEGFSLSEDALAVLERINPSKKDARRYGQPDQDTVKREKG